jgi:hypothetical protein
MAYNNPDTSKILDKYGRKLSMFESFNPENAKSEYEISNEFTLFKEDMMPQLSRFERLCNNIGGMIKLKLAQKDEARLQKEINSAHVNVTPSQVVSLAMLSFILVFIGGLLLSVAIYMFTLSFSFLMVFLSLFAAGFLFYYFYSAPGRLANQWRLKAGSQFVPCVLYTVVYMKHTSNLERAIRFASQHLEPPLALDLRKVFWDVETGRFSTIKESLDNYLETWRETNSEFIESFNLIESSLFEPSEARRIQILERALQVILDGVYDKMLKYTHDVKSPLTNIYMLGIVLPTLGLALLPLASALLSGAIKWYHVIILFNVLIPFMVFYMTNEVMIKRPGGYGETSILELNPLYPKYKSKKPYLKAFFMTFPLLIIGLIPLLLQISGLADLIGIKQDYNFSEIGLGFFGNTNLFDFVKGAGPMGVVSVMCSFFIPLSIFLFFSISYKERTRELIKSRDFSKKLEAEFNNSLFQLGNRIGDGTPAELAFGRVAESAKGLMTENFFRQVNSNIQGLGMSLEKAVFDNKRGAIINYPSNLIATSMHILIESVKKGLSVAAQALMSIADYVRNINKINERLRDLLADVISDMKSNMVFLAPLLAGIVVGLASMITLILSKLSLYVSAATESGTEAASLGAIGNIVNLFEVSKLISPYFLQISIGIYLIEIVFILTKTLVTVDSGKDELKETYDIAKNSLAGGLLYLVVAFIATLALSVLAGIPLSSLNV